MQNPETNPITRKAKSVQFAHHLLGAATFRWILKCIRQKTDSNFMVFPFRRTTKIILYMTKNIILFCFHLEAAKQELHIYGTFVEFFKHRFVMHPLQNPPLCTVVTSFRNHHVRSADNLLLSL